MVNGITCTLGANCSVTSGGSGISTITGDLSATGTGTVTGTLATVNSGPGACGDSTHVCNVTTNGKGLVTGQSAVAITAGGTSINSVPFCAGFSPTAGQSLQYTTGGTPDPCYAALTTIALPSTGTAPIASDGSGGVAVSTASNIVGVFSGCSGKLLLGADGACHATCAPPASGALLVKSDGAGCLVAAIPGVDYVVGTPSILSGSFSTTPLTVNLTTLPALDYIVPTPGANTFTAKAGTPIMSIAIAGSGGLNQSGPAINNYTYTDGAGGVMATNSQYVFLKGVAGATSITITAPASTVTRTSKVEFQTYFGNDSVVTATLAGATVYTSNDLGWTATGNPMGGTYTFTYSGAGTLSVVLSSAGAANTIEFCAAWVY